MWSSRTPVSPTSIRSSSRCPVSGDESETSPGDDILTYAPLALYRQGVFDKAPDLDQPYDLQGRRVNTEHYGTGVGRNTWKNKNVVCLIGDYFLPRNATIAEA